MDRSIIHVNAKLNPAAVSAGDVMMPLPALRGSANAPNGSIYVVSYLGTAAGGALDWPTLLSGTDAIGVADAQIPITADLGYLITGNLSGINQTYNRMKAATATNMLLTESASALLVSEPGDYTWSAGPAVNTLATVSTIAFATDASICTGISFSLADTNPIGTGPGLLRVYLRDGASGVGPILWEQVVFIQGGQSKHVNITGLHIVGSLNTVMTLEFSGAPGVTGYETVTMMVHAAGLS